MATIKTRARAVDMLGRQQIAGTQNAISEIFKNAYDAYASTVEIDFFEEEKTLVIRDNGIGMTMEDFEEKWLVLGTDSKAGINRELLFRPHHSVPRPITGEKGIGRLAIALLGRQVLIMTRAIREDGLHELVVALVHWGLFELPGINIDDIEIPLSTIKKGEIPSSDDIGILKSQLRGCINRLRELHPSISFEKITKELAGFHPDPVDLDTFLTSIANKNLSLKGDGFGTHFIVAPANSVLEIELAAEERNQDWSFRKYLLGFTNDAFKADSLPDERFHTSFKRWSPGSLVGEELLDPETFFSKEDMVERSDHFLKGDVDEFGQFRGSIRVYDEYYPEIVIPWQNATGGMTQCGPFSVTFGYLMGLSRESLVPDTEYAGMRDKLDKIGGIYVYRDGVRILPYGDFSVDWLEVEKRRSKGAGYYFWSYRRMFGAVLLTREKNNSLQEKAGREGFQQNKPYRELREILINLLTSLVAEFFREGNEKGDLFEKTQTEMTYRAAALMRQQKQAGTKRKKFQKDLNNFSEQVSSGFLENEIAELRNETQRRMEAVSKIKDQDVAASALIKAERRALSSLSDLKEQFTIRRPTGVALTKNLAREWDGYKLERKRLDTEYFTLCENEISSTLGGVAMQAKLYIDQRKRLEQRLETLASDRQKQLGKAAVMARESASDTRKTVFDITQKAMGALDLKVKQIQADLNSTDLAALTDEKVESVRKAWEHELEEIESHHRDALIKARDMLASLAENLRNSDGGAPAEAMEALEDRMLSLEEEADQNFEMVQLGLAVAIINHEFASAIRNVRNSVRELGKISKRSPSLEQLYTSIRQNFEHLDGHLKLFTPLQRRLYRNRQEIGGHSIRNYIKDLFGVRIQRHNIKLEFTDIFLESTVSCFPSTLYPAIINLVDNAIFWLDSRNDNRTILLDISGSNIVIANTGPAIESRDINYIFNRGFSRRPGGRGLGLFISSRALKDEGMDLVVAPPPPDFSVAFHISAPTLQLQHDRT